MYMEILKSQKLVFLLENSFHKFKGGFYPGWKSLRNLACHWQMETNPKIVI